MVLDPVLFFLNWFIGLIAASRLLPFGGRPAVGFGPKLEEMNPRTFPDLPICPRTFDFDQKTLKTTKNKLDFVIPHPYSEVNAKMFDRYF